MIDYISRRSIRWVPVNAAASVLGAVAMLAVFDVSGGRREMLQFRYAGTVYALVVGAAFLWMSRETRKAMANHQQRATRLSPGDEGVGFAHNPAYDLSDAGSEPDMFEIHEHRIYHVYKPRPDSGQELSHPAAASDDPSKRLAGPNSENGPDVIDASYRVIS